MKGGSHIHFGQTAEQHDSRLRELSRSAALRAGFTIVEVMIVLAITGLLFVSAVALISGRQNRTEFQTSINNVKTQLQQVISDVETGFYPTTNNLVCSVGGSGALSFSTASNTQGSSQDCIFLGKVLQFGVQNTDPQQIMAYSIAGRRQLNKVDVTSYTDAAPAVMTTSASNPTNIPTSILKLQYGLTIKPNSLTYTSGGTTTQIGAVGFMSTLNAFDTNKSGAQSVQLVPIKNTSLNQTPAAAVTAINANLPTSTINPSGGVSMCFVSNGSDQSGLITIGGNGRELSVTLSIRGNNTCS